MTLPGLLLPLLLLPATPHPENPDRCEVRREVSGELDAMGLEGVIITASSGELDVTGTRESTVRVQGVICASSPELADDALLIVERHQNGGWIEVDLPRREGRRGEYVRMDLVVTMPRTLPADIDDGSGGMRVRGLAAVRIDDGSGDIEVEDIEGDVLIDDGSGGIRIREAGAVRLDDGSGEIDIEGVLGDVRVFDDGSGGIDIRRVGGSVRIDEDGSGSIWVVEVAGDLVVLDDGSGSISHRRVQGRVDLPRRR